MLVSCIGTAIGHEYRDHANAILPFWRFPVQTFFPAIMIYTALYASFTYILRSVSYFAKAPFILDAVIIGLLIYSLSVLFDQETQNWYVGFYQ